MFYWPLGWYSSYCAAQLVTGSTDVPEAYNLSQLQNTNHCISWGVNFSFRPLIKLLNGRIFNLYNKYSILLADPVFWGFVQAFFDVASIGDWPTIHDPRCHNLLIEHKFGGPVLSAGTSLAKWLSKVTNVGRDTKRWVKLKCLLKTEAHVRFFLKSVKKCFFECRLHDASDFVDGIISMP